MRIIYLMISMWIGLMSYVYALPSEWVSLTGSIDDLPLLSCKINPCERWRYAALSRKSLYLSINQGASWKKVMSLSSQTSQLNFVEFSKNKAAWVYVGTSKGLKLSFDYGEHWQKVELDDQKTQMEVFCILEDSHKQSVLWVGSEKGLYLVNRQNKARFVPYVLRNKRVFALQANHDFSVVFANTNQGIYETRDYGKTWNKIYASKNDSENPQDETSLAQLRVEEVLLTPFSGFLNLSDTGQSLLAYSSGQLLEFNLEQTRTSYRYFENTPSKNIYAAKQFKEKTYLATDKGIYKSDDKGAFVELSENYDGKPVHDMDADPESGILLMVTDAGIYRYQVMENLNVAATQDLQNLEQDQKPRVLLDWRELEKQFAYEPSIAQTQMMAIRYAEVHPDKITEWRKQAAKKAWLPSLSLNSGVDVDNNIDVDRGGTNDADRFIEGPEDKSFDWSVSASWDLGDLVWNDDQTSIDTRSKLMSELRDDILTQVNHVYFERRRHQIQMLMVPSLDPSVEVERQIRLAELTAILDGLTGGDFSKAMKGRN